MITGNPLSHLHPLHVPPPVSWWPPAPGWWLLSVATMIVAGMSYYYWHRAAPKRAALNILRNINASSYTDVQWIAHINLLLRRYVRLCYPDAHAETRTGIAWLDFLEQHDQAGALTEHIKQTLCHAPYLEAHTDRWPIDRPELSRWLMQWLRANPVRHTP